MPDGLLLRAKPEIKSDAAANDMSLSDGVNTYASYIMNKQPQQQYNYNPWLFGRQNEPPKKEEKPILLNSFEVSLNGKQLEEGQNRSKNTLLEILLELASKYGILELVLQKRDHRNRTPLIYCIHRSQVDSAKMIIAETKSKGLAGVVHNAVIDKTPSVEDPTKEIELHKSVLLLALQKKQFDIAESLELTPADLAFTDINGANAFHYLARLHSEKVPKSFEKYRNAGVPMVADKFGRYPIHYAVSCLLEGDTADILTEPVEWLLKFDKVGVNAQDEKGRTPLHYAFVPIDEDEKKAQEITTQIDSISIVTLLVKAMNSRSVRFVTFRPNGPFPEGFFNLFLDP